MKRVICVGLSACLSFAVWGQGQKEAPTVLSRLVPELGVDVLKHPPLAHGKPGVEAEFVDALTREPVFDYPKLGTIVETTQERVVRNDFGIMTIPEQDPKSVLYGLHMSDAQIVDERSPALTFTNDPTLDGKIFEGSYRPQSAYLAHTAKALIDSAKQHGPYDLALHTGDALEDAAENELKWFLTLLDGGTFSPNSGPAFDLIPGPNNDPNDEITSQGLQTPWLSTIGNHDILAQGNFPIGLLVYLNSPQIAGAGLQQAFGKAGIAIPNVGDRDEVRNQFTEEQLYHIPIGFDADDKANDGLIAGLNVPFALEHISSNTDLQQAFAQFYQNGQLNPQKIAADSARAHVDRCKFIKAHLEASGLPKGHGFTANQNGPDGSGECVGHYAYTSPNFPQLRVINVDFATSYAGAEAVFAHPQKEFDMSRLVDRSGQLIVDPASSVSFSSNAQGMLVKSGSTIPLFTLPAPQGDVNTAYANDANKNGILFLKKQLDEALAQKQLVMVSSHHASESLQRFNRLRIQFETVLCGLLAAPDCDPSDGTMSTGHIGLPVKGAQAPGNVQALNLFAQIVGQAIGQPIADYQGLKQAHLNALAQNAPDAFKRLASGFTLLFSIRNLLPDPIQPMDTVAFRKLLASYANVVLHLAGHSHNHRIFGVCADGTAISAEDAAKRKFCTGGRGYYEMRTAANADWPMEWRTFEIVDNNNGSLSIFGTAFGPGLQTSAMVATARRLALSDVMLSGSTGENYDHPGDVNVKLVVPVPEFIDKMLDTVAHRRAVVSQ